MLRTNLYSGPDRVALVTVTAPGADVLPWDGARVDPAAAREWNRSAAGRWSKLNAAIRERLRRYGCDTPLLAYVWQLQRRGVLHVHLVLDFAAGERAARLYVAFLRELAPSYGFGFVDFRDRDGKGGRSSVMPREVAAGYLSRYANSGQLAEAAALPRAVRPTRLVYVSRALTAVTRCTMRRLRRVRFLWWIRRGRSVFAHAGNLPSWFADPLEYGAVCSLARGP